MSISLTEFKISPTSLCMTGNELSLSDNDKNILTKIGAVRSLLNFSYSFYKYNLYEIYIYSIGDKYYKLHIDYQRSMLALLHISITIDCSYYSLEESVTYIINNFNDFMKNALLWQA